MDAVDDSAEACDCAPTAAERRVLWNPMSRRRALAIGAVLGVAAIGAVTVASPFGSAAVAATYNPDDYPSWADVEKARNDESAKASEVTRIENLIAGLKQRVAETQAAAEAAADAYYEAQQAYYQAAYRADELQKQADEQSAKADEAALTASRLAAQLARSGGDDTSLEILFAGSSENADQLLTQLGQMDKLIERNESVYAQAAAARDSAQSLTDQAEVARTERDRLQKIAEEKMAAALEAQQAAEAALADQEENLITLEAQLAALKDTTSKTTAEYEEGVEAKRQYEEQLRREAEQRAREEAERQRLLLQQQQQQQLEQQQQQQQQQQQEQNNSGGGGGGNEAPADNGGGTTQNGSGGWVRPNNGVQTSGYGYRSQQCGSSYCSTSFHAGVDLAQGCGSAIYAAHSGTVVYSGYNGGYGNYIRIDNGDGTATGYAHIVDGGLLVGNGQWVEAGQLIALEGNTGNSFGCHLHFEVYVNGATVNPIDFMAARGIWV
ncbi:peptidoglycan DD-metalloendopeptidase family protein [Microbacterium betulae]|uniref:Peptidoglycan DD-metalloendopeptidase family protein n=1 Tax=Microbacterium betulae TaxID=2981139 RepID=A0AA97I606_9MICO|nr:peptidoglycan DD-metalloendopeptidase family protein [Microbacterium sp. AB]WOF22617.1 peptidoglycan DD-metalloendopeptidase family protein [Microbacterium sp. AB]